MEYFENIFFAYFNKYTNSAAIILVITYFDILRIFRFNYSIILNNLPNIKRGIWRWIFLKK